MATLFLDKNMDSSNNTMNGGSALVTPVISRSRHRQDTSAMLSTTSSSSSSSSSTEASNTNDLQNHLFAKLLSGEPILTDDLCQAEPFLASIPVLNRDNIDNLEPGCLVRVRGFTQDLFDAEYYQQSSSQNDDDELDPRGLQGLSLTERTPIFITPIPFTTSWYRDEEQENEEDVQHRQSKRLRRSGSISSNDNLFNQQNSNTETNPHVAAKHDNDSHWWKPGTNGSDPSFPPVLAKFYYEQYNSRSRVRLNDIVELIGILDREEETSDEDGVQLELSFGMEMSSNAVPVSIPRVHVLSFESCLPLERPASTIQMMPSQLPTPQECLAQALSTPVSSPAAACLFLTLLSNAEREKKTAGSNLLAAPSKTPTGATLGCASLNLTLPNAGACQRFQKQLKTTLTTIVPCIQSINVTSETLGTTLSSPSKIQGRLVPHALQLPKGATLILNTCEMTEGTLSPDEVVALQMLQTLAQSHCLDYRFDGNMRLSFEADWRIIVLPTPLTHKLIPCALQAKWDGSDTPCSTENQLAVVHSFRNHLEAARSMGNIQISKAVLERAPLDFCKLREAERQHKNPTQRKIQEEDFHRWLTLTRLFARHRQSPIAEVCDWESAVSLDRSQR